jgi:hypothetical protein
VYNSYVQINNRNGIIISNTIHKGEKMKIPIKLFSLCVSLTVIIILGLSGQSYAKIDPATCTGAWVFNDPSADVLKDISGNANDCTIKGKPKWVDSTFGKAIDFDATDDLVECPDNDPLDVGTDNFSVVAWIKCAKYDPGEWEAQIIFKLEHAVPRHGYLLAVRGSLDAGNKNKPVFIMGLGDASGIHTFGTSPINDDTWHHLAVTVDRSNSVIMYRDGEIEAQQNIAGYAKQNEDNSRVFNIGSETGTPGRYIKGTIDDVALFKTVLTPADISDLMNFGLEKILGGKAVQPFDKLASTWADVKIR